METQAGWGVGGISKVFVQSLRTRPFERISVNLINTGMGMSGYYTHPTIVRYCCDSDFKDWIDTGAQFEMTPPTTVTTSGL